MISQAVRWYFRFQLSLRDITARTTLVATLYQSRHDARESCADHARIVDALEAGDRTHAEALMLEHIGSVESALGQSITDSVSAVDKLRATLQPLAPTKSSRLT